MISRRKLISTGAITGAAYFVLPSMAQPPISTPSTKPGAEEVSNILRVTHSSDGEYVQMMNSQFPGLMEDPYFAAIRSHSVLVTNVSSTDINAFSTRWAITTPTGGYDAPIHHYFAPEVRRKRTVHFGVSGERTRFTGAIPALKAGTSRLVTPYFCWGASYFRNHLPKNWQDRLNNGPSSKFFYYELSRASRLVVSIDAVIINQKDVLGDDFGQLGRKYRITRNAEHDEALILYKAKAAGQSDSQIRDLLLAHSDGVFAANDLPTPEIASVRDYMRVRQRQARVLLRRLKNAGPEQLHKTVSYLAHRRRTTTV